PRLIVGGAGLDRNPPSCTFLIWNPRPAYWATYPSDSSLHSDGRDDVASLFVASHTHLFHSISGFDNLYLFHVAPVLGAICYFLSTTIPPQPGHVRFLPTSRDMPR